MSETASSLADPAATAPEHPTLDFIDHLVVTLGEIVALLAATLSLLLLFKQVTKAFECIKEGPPPPADGVPLVASSSASAQRRTGAAAGDNDTLRANIKRTFVLFSKGLTYILMRIFYVTCPLYSCGLLITGVILLLVEGDSTGVVGWWFVGVALALLLTMPLLKPYYDRQLRELGDAKVSVYKR